jgi:tyrosine-protein phosphatase YwqE
MISIFKKQYPSQPIDLSLLVTDIHSHLLPGIDDGSPDVETSLQLINGLEELGIRQFITTPHIMGDMYKNTPASIHQALTQLMEASVASKRNIKLIAAAEYYLDDHLTSLLQVKEPLLSVQQKSVLVEFSFMYQPMNLKDQLFEVQVKGYQIILAHPERYAYFSASKKIYDEFKSLGCFFQVNLLSFEGYYGKTAQELALHLVSKNYIDFVGTDLHHKRHLTALQQSSQIMPVLKKLLHSGKLKNSTLSV